MPARARRSFAQPVGKGSVAECGTVTIPAGDQKSINGPLQIRQSVIGYDVAPDGSFDRVDCHSGEGKTIEVALGIKVRHRESFHRSAEIHRHDVRVYDNDDVTLQAG